MSEDNQRLLMFMIGFLVLLFMVGYAMGSYDHQKHIREKEVIQLCLKNGQDVKYSPGGSILGCEPKK